MKKVFLLQCIFTALVFFAEGCSSDDHYCCTSNDQCGSVHGKDTFCTMDECGQCKAPEQPLQISADWKDAIVGKPYEVVLTASGGFSPYDWVNFKKVNDGDNKLDWLVFEKDTSKSEIAYLRNDTNNGQPILPSTPTIDTDALTIEVTVQDNTRYGNSGGIVFSHVIKINECGEASDCTNLPPSSDAACVDAACNAGKCEYTLKSTDTVCLAGGCRDGFIYNDKKCNASGLCVAPNPEGTSCNGYQCADGTSCKASCSIQADCAGALLCKNDNTCTSPQALGATCTVDGECASNHCANGHCCENACNGLCQACGGNGLCNQAPTDDSRCGTIDCSLLNTTCRTYSNLTANRCASPGACKAANSSSWCTVFTKHPGAVCRASTDATCDPAESCDTNGDCPANAFVSNGTQCGSGNCAACTNGVCGQYQASCTSGNCGICSGSGSGSSAVWNCAADNSKCPDSCRPCTGSGTAWSCDYVPPPITFSAANLESPIPIGYSTTLTWDSPCATSCDPSASPATDTWDALLPNQGSSTQSPAATTTYSLACTSAPGKTSNVNTTVEVKSWNDTSGTGFSGESCDAWLSRTNQSGIKGSGSRVLINSSGNYSPGTIFDNSCIYIQTCHISGGSNESITYACLSNATSASSTFGSACGDFCTTYYGGVVTAFAPTYTSNIPILGGATTQTRR